jgi:hypothetical protein
MQLLSVQEPCERPGICGILCHLECIPSSARMGTPSSAMIAVHSLDNSRMFHIHSYMLAAGRMRRALLYIPRLNFVQINFPPGNQFLHSTLSLIVTRQELWERRSLFHRPSRPRAHGEQQFSIFQTQTQNQWSNTTQIQSELGEGPTETLRPNRSSDDRGEGPLSCGDCTEIASQYLLPFFPRSFHPRSHRWPHTCDESERLKGLQSFRQVCCYTTLHATPYLVACEI